MKYFVQYYYDKPECAPECMKDKPKHWYIEPCGDRAVVILDGRNNIDTMHQDAILYNGHNRPVYAAYRLFNGTFLQNTPISGIIPL